MNKAWSEQAIMMTLSAIAYQSDIAGAAQRKRTLPPLATGRWRRGPIQDGFGNLAYVAVSASTGNYALVIRGSLTTFTWAALENWFYNLDVMLRSFVALLPQRSGVQSFERDVLAGLRTSCVNLCGTDLLGFVSHEVRSGFGQSCTLPAIVWAETWRTVLPHGSPCSAALPPGSLDPNTRPYTFARAVTWEHRLCFSIQRTFSQQLALLQRA